MLDLPTNKATVTPLPQRIMSNMGFAGLMVLDIFIPASRSLKDKRKPLRSIQQRLRNAGYSASEVDHHEKWQRSQFAISIVGRGSNHVEQLLDEALRICESRPDIDVTVRQRTVMSISDYD